MLSTTASNASPSAAEIEECGTHTSSPLFLQGLREDSNLELDWLWLAAQLANQHEQRICLMQALTINPQSELAQRSLALLPTSGTLSPKRTLLQQLTQRRNDAKAN